MRVLLLTKNSDAALRTQEILKDADFCQSILNKVPNLSPATIVEAHSVVDAKQKLRVPGFATFFYANASDFSSWDVDAVKREFDTTPYWLPRQELDKILCSHSSFRTKIDPRLQSIAVGISDAIRAHLEREKSKLLGYVETFKPQSKLHRAGSVPVMTTQAVLVGHRASLQPKALQQLGLTPHLSGSITHIPQPSPKHNQVAPEPLVRNSGGLSVIVERPTSLAAVVSGKAPAPTPAPAPALAALAETVPARQQSAANPPSQTASPIIGPRFSGASRRHSSRVSLSGNGTALFGTPRLAPQPPPPVAPTVQAEAEEATTCSCGPFSF